MATRRLPDLAAPQTVVFLAYVVPLVAVIALGSTLYDGWRHLLFIAPGAIALVLAGISESARISSCFWHRQGQVRSAAFNSVAVAAVLVAISGLIASHPYPSVYKNALIFEIPDFEDDYWALSTWELVNHVVSELRETSANELSIYPAVLMPTYKLARYAAVDEDGIEFVDAIEDADFVMTTFRSITNRDAHLSQISPNGAVVHEVYVQNRVIGLLVRRGN